MKGVCSKIKYYFLSLVMVTVVFFSFHSVSAEEFLQVAVPVNPYNSMAEQLKAKEGQLNQREQALASLQAKLEKSYDKIFVLIAGLFILILLNFIFDQLRKRKQTESLITENNLIKH